MIMYSELKFYRAEFKRLKAKLEDRGKALRIITSVYLKYKAGQLDPQLAVTMMGEEARDTLQREGQLVIKLM